MLIHESCELTYTYASRVMFIGKIVCICLVGSVNLVLKFQGQPGEIMFHQIAPWNLSGVLMSFNTKLSEPKGKWRPRFQWMWILTHLQIHESYTRHVNSHKRVYTYACMRVIMSLWWYVTHTRVMSTRIHVYIHTREWEWLRHDDVISHIH